MKGPYDDIIHLPHPVSKTHSRMSMIERAAQFSPFAALTGYGAAIKETARLTDRKLELDEETQALLDLPETGIADAETWTAVEALSLQLAAKTPNPDRDAEQGLAYPGRAVTQGSIGPDVMQVEQWLNGRANLYCGEAFVQENSSFGPAETVAVKAAQARAGLEQTGIVNRETWAALRAQSCECEEE